MGDILADVKRVTKDTAAEFTGEALKIGQWAICLNTDKPEVDDQLVRREAGGTYKFYDIENIANFAVVNVTASFVPVGNKIYLCDTTSGDITATLDDATGTSFQSRIYKITGIESPDVIITTSGGTQSIGGSTSQTIYGESEGLYVVENTDSYTVIQDNLGRVPKLLSQSSMVLKGCEVSNLTESVPASGVFDTFDMAPGLYQKETITANDYTNPVSETHRFQGLTGVLVPDVSASTAFTVVSITSETTVKLTSGVFPTIADQAENPRVAVLEHIYGTINPDIIPWWTGGSNPSSRISASHDFDGLQQKGIVISAASTDLSIAYTSGIFKGDSINAHFAGATIDLRDIDASTPSEVVIVPTLSKTVNKFLPALVGASALIDPTKYDDGTAVPASIGGATGSTTIQRVFMLTNETLFVSYGQNIYGSFNDAIAALFNGDETFTIHPKLAETSVHVANIVLGRTCTDLSDTSLARFYEPLAGGSSPSVATGKFDDLLDTPSSKTGQALKGVRINAAEIDLEYHDSHLISSYDDFKEFMNEVITSPKDYFVVNDITVPAGDTLGSSDFIKKTFRGATITFADNAILGNGTTQRVNACFHNPVVAGATLILENGAVFFRSVNGFDFDGENSVIEYEKLTSGSISVTEGSSSASQNNWDNTSPLGWTGTFVNGDGDTVTVTTGIITGVA